MKYVKVIALFFLLLVTWGNAQTAGINYQALILNREELEVPGNNIAQGQVPLSNQEVYFRFSVTGDPATDFTQYYEEGQLAVTDANGLVSLVVGEGAPLFSSFVDIVWDGTPKYLNVEIDIVGSGDGFTFLDSQKILYLPQNGSIGVQRVSNGLTKIGNTFSLGGALSQPTILETSIENTLALKGLPSGDVSKDHLLAVDRKTGVLKQVKAPGFMQGEERKITAREGQTLFATPLPIKNPNHIKVYRNGIKIDFTVIDATTLELEDGVVCYQDDEIRIVQYN